MSKKPNRPRPKPLKEGFSKGNTKPSDGNRGRQAPPPPPPPKK